MRIKEFIVYVIVHLLFFPFSYVIFVALYHFTFDTAFAVNIAVAMLISTIIHAIFEFSYWRVDEERDRSKRNTTRWFGVACVIFLIPFILFTYHREAVYNLDHYERFGIYLIPIVITILLTIRFKPVLDEMRYDI